MTETFDPRALAAGLHSLRQAGRQEATDTFALPADLHQAMEAQDLLAAADGISSNAWKVTVSPQGQAVTAPLHPYAEAVSGADIPWYPGLKFETEIAVRLGSDLPVRTGAPYSRTEVVEAISAVHLGAELLVSAVRESGSVSFLLFVADRLGNSGYVLGPKLEKALSTPSAARRSRSPMPPARSMMVRHSIRRATFSPGLSITPMTACARRHR